MVDLPRMTSVVVSATHVSRNSTSFTPFKVSVTNSSAATDASLASLIGAFRAELAVVAPEHLCRKWSMLCGFEGCGASGGVRRAIPLFRVVLPASVTSATPSMTPSASSDYHGIPLVRAEGEVQKEALSSLLLPLVTTADCQQFEWRAKVVFVVGEDEDEERARRKEEREAARLALAAQPAIEIPQPPANQNNINSDVFQFGAFGSGSQGLFGGGNQGLFGNQSGAAPAAAGGWGGAFGDPSNVNFSASQKVPAQKVPSQQFGGGTSLFGANAARPAKGLFNASNVDPATFF